MSGSDSAKTTVRSSEDLAKMIIRVAETARADALICATETETFVQHLRTLTTSVRLIAATANGDTYDALERAGLEAIRLPLRAVDRYGQVRHIISVALRSASVSAGDFVVVAIGRDAHPNKGTLVVLTDVEPDLEYLAISDLLKLTDGIRPTVLEAAVEVACKVGRAARRGKRLGAIFVLGDSVKVLAGSQQLIPNPFQGHDENSRRLTNPDNHTALLELSKLDGAFVVRGDGLIQTAGTFLASMDVDVRLPPGLGARHHAAAAVTVRTAATAVVVSATDGNVRVFSQGHLVLEVDPEVPHGPVDEEV